MRVPSHLTGEARAYWQRHAKHLTEAGILTPKTADSFEQLCWCWADTHRFRTLATENPAKIRNYQDSVRLWKSLAAEFGLLPGKNTPPPPAEPDEFGL